MIAALLFLACDSPPAVSGGGTVWLWDDEDGDGFGTGEPRRATSPTDVGAVRDGDCDDTNAAVRPDAAETCDGVDNDCDGAADEGITQTMWPDGDEDGYGDWLGPVDACGLQPGFVPRGGDCDDADSAIRPDASEACDGRDENCDGTVDEGVTQTVFVDADLDGYGDPAQPRTVCEEEVGLRADGDDCDDARADVHPGATEVCNDGADTDCDGLDSCRLTGSWAASAADRWLSLGEAGNEDQADTPALAMADVTEDGIADLLVGRPGLYAPYAVYDGGTGWWSVEWLRGGLSMLGGETAPVGLPGVLTEVARLDELAAITLPSNTASTRSLGESVLIGQFDDPGRAAVLVLDGDDIDSPRAWTLDAPLAAGDGWTDAHAASQIAPMGDADGDGLDELWSFRMGDPDTYPYEADFVAGPLSAGASLGDRAAVVLLLEGRPSSGAGCDLDGDGLANPILAESDIGVRIWSGTPTSSNPDDADATLTTNTSVVTLACADVSADGWLDLLVGGGNRVAAHPGGSVVDGVLDVAGAWSGDASSDNFGASLATGDVDGDGFVDVAVGAPGADLAYLIPGPATPPDRSDALVFTGDAGSGLGASVAVGDLNGDAFDDVALSAPTGASSNLAIFWGRGW